jgi:hypothetical protein
MARSENPVVSAVREVFPGFDLSLWSKSQYPDRYGIKLVPRAQLIADKAQKRPVKKDGHKGHTISWRAEKPLLDRLQTAKQTLGIITTQEFITVAILHLLKEMEEE